MISQVQHPLRAGVALGLCLSSLLCLPAICQTSDEKVFAPVPGALRSRLIERLNLFVQYDRAGDFDKKFEMLDQRDRDVLKVNKAGYVKLMQNRLAGDKAERTLDFRIKSVEHCIVNDKQDFALVMLRGDYQFLKGKKHRPKTVERLIEAHYFKGEWYFSDWLTEFVNY